MNVCENPEILKVIYFFLIILDIVKIIIPIALIVMGLVDFSKAVIISDDKVQGKSVNLFLKRILYAVLIFAVPWIVKVVMISLGNLTKGVNFTDCIENANGETIKKFDNGICALCKDNANIKRWFYNGNFDDVWDADFAGACPSKGWYASDLSFSECQSKIVVNYDANGGLINDTKEKLTKEYYTNDILISLLNKESVKKDNFVFWGWAENDCSYAKTQLMIGKAEYSLLACWASKVTLHANGGIFKVPGLFVGRTELEYIYTTIYDEYSAIDSKEMFTFPDNGTLIEGEGEILSIEKEGQSFFAWSRYEDCREINFFGGDSVQVYGIMDYYACYK